MIPGLFGRASLFAVMLGSGCLVWSAAGALEAPMLNARVEAGELPPVEERLPSNPLVVEPVDRVGDYGGNWHSALLGGGDGPWIQRTVSYENLMRWTPDWTDVIPNIAEAVDVNEDATIFRFTLREGMKWSDGEPFTADDIRFWYEDLFMNREFTPSPTEPFISSDGSPVEFEMIDDVTFEFRFSQPKGLFLQYLATARPLDIAPVLYPRHYLEQFHPDYNPDVNDEVVRAGQVDWVGLMSLRAGYMANVNVPTLHPWIFTVGYGEGDASRAEAVRNPYYWKVDTDGNQLPYIDTRSFDIISDPQVLVTSALAGDIHYQDRHLSTTQNRPVLFQGQEAGGYELIEQTPVSPNYVVLMLNLNHRDPERRELYQNKDFRIGLSHGMDREEILDVVWVGQGQVAQTSPLPGSIYYNERLATQYTEYDVDLANEYLDRVMPERNSEGVRLLPNGQPFVLEFAFSAATPIFGDVLELLSEQWAQIGIDMRPTSLDRTLIEVRRDAGELDAIAWERGGGDGQEVVLDPRWWFPSNSDSYYWAPAWAAHSLNVNPAISQVEPEVPPAAVLQQIDLYEQLQATPDFDEQVALMNEILDIAAEEFWTMGIAWEASGYAVKRSDFMNVPDTMPASWIYPTPGPTNPEQYFIAAN